MSFIEKEVDLGHLIISYKQWGQDSSFPQSHVPVLLVHGWLDNANSFDQVISHLPNDRLYLAIDLPGHGHSSHKANGQLYHFLDGVADIKRLIDSLGFEKVILVGHSLGAALSSVFSSVYPEVVEKVCLIEAVGPISSDPKDSARQLRDSIEKQIKGVGRNLVAYSSLDEMAQARQKGIGGLTYEASLKLVERSHKSNESGFFWSTDPKLRLPSPMRLSESQVKGFLSKLSVPLKVIIAENSLIPRDVIDLRLSYFTDPDVVQLPGGHHLHMEESALSVAEELNSFING
ncbi:alpha/beta fold hydrolase [Litoribrevibacter albus]|uniref:Alpha/beta hydrolase n=1 Tax=Litoribrevibacter albus TaxID=1473156 RepID=A0AA37SBU1_9GAMM|nr:alpha/beta hydrolase [Litoribrevibacter albus]GLQ31913.1 alpha/beta hydrolase [Litoribrevibacter albus]